MMKKNDILKEKKILQKEKYITNNKYIYILIFLYWLYLRSCFINRLKILKKKAEKYSSLFYLLGSPYNYKENIGAVFYYKGNVRYKGDSRKKEKAYIKRICRIIPEDVFEYFTFENFKYSTDLFDPITIEDFKIFLFFTAIMLLNKVYNIVLKRLYWQHYLIEKIMKAISDF